MGKRELIPCPVCNNAEFQTLFSKADLDFVKCRGCGLVYINPQPSDDEINALYSKDYYNPWGLERSYSRVAEMKIATFRARLTAVEKFMAKGRVLDIGCATGFFLEAARERGWDVFGVELSPFSSAIAQARFGNDRVFRGELAEAVYSEGFFDVVFMSDLIEHVKDLNGFMEELRRITKDKGIAAIATPNTESLSYKVMKRHWPHLKLEHLYYFSPATIKRLLEEHGFRLLYVTPASKALSLSYIEGHFSTYPVPVLTPAIKSVVKLLPESVTGGKFMVRTGELFAVAEKVG